MRGLHVRLRVHLRRARGRLRRDPPRSPPTRHGPGQDPHIGPSRPVLQLPQNDPPRFTMVDTCRVARADQEKANTPPSMTSSAELERKLKGLVTTCSRPTRCRLCHRSGTSPRARGRRPRLSPRTSRPRNIPRAGPVARVVDARGSPQTPGTQACGRHVTGCPATTDGRGCAECVPKLRCGRRFSQVRYGSGIACKSVAKASEVRILYPPRPMTDLCPTKSVGLVGRPRFRGRAPDSTVRAWSAGAGRVWAWTSESANGNR